MSWYKSNPKAYLATDSAIMHMHELNFLKIMINWYLLDTRDNIEPLYRLEIIQKYGSNTKRFIDDILTVAPGLLIPNRKGHTFEKKNKREGGEGGMYGGTYPEHILDDDGEKVANPEATQKNKECKQCMFRVWRFSKVRLECGKFECRINWTT